MDLSHLARSRPLSVDASAIRGFLVPEFSEEVTGPDGRIRHNHGLTRQGFDEVVQGYACGECLARFTVPLANCAVCGLPTMETRAVQPTPEMWQQHLDERHMDIDEAIARQAERIPADFDTFLEQVMADGDVDHANLSALRESRPGARRS